MGKRGEGWVAAQFALLALLFVVPDVGPEWPFWLRIVAGIAGVALLLTAASFGLAGFKALGDKLTPFITPVGGAVLRTDGVYACVRHPIYTGVLSGAFGIALVTGSLSRIAVALLLTLVLHLKSKREEQHLQAQFPEYRDYRQRVRKLIPGIW